MDDPRPLDLYLILFGANRPYIRIDVHSKYHPQSETTHHHISTCVNNVIWLMISTISNTIKQLSKIQKNKRSDNSERLQKPIYRLLIGELCSLQYVV